MFTLLYMNDIDDMGRSILWYCHRAIDPVLNGTQSYEINENAILELSLCAIATDRDPIALAQKMAILGYNREHQCDIDIPSRALEDSGWGVEPLVVVVGLAHYPNWWDLIPHTDTIFAEFERAYSPELIVSEFETMEADSLAELGVRVPYPLGAYGDEDY